jgi:hypothetical protein
MRLTTNDAFVSLRGLLQLAIIHFSIDQPQTEASIGGPVIVIIVIVAS